jgi:hypothetical protein
VPSAFTMLMYGQLATVNLEKIQTAMLSSQKGNRQNSISVIDTFEKSFQPDAEPEMINVTIL